MGEAWRGRPRRHLGWFGGEEGVVQAARHSVDGYGYGYASASSSGSGTRGGGRGGWRHDGEVEESRCCLRRFENLLAEGKAYPLPHPMQFERLSAGGAGPDHGSLRSGERKEQQAQGISSGSGKRVPARRSCSDRLESSSGRGRELGDLGFVCQSEDRDHAGVTATTKKKPNRVVVVYDGKKKFTTAPLDIAINGYATSEGDSIVVVAYLDHVTVRPIGMKVTPDTEQFRGVNDAAALKPAVYMKKMEIESKLREWPRLQWCQTKKIHLDVKVLPGSNSKALVAKEIVTLQTTTAIFDKNAMKSRKYYEENLSCHVLRLRSDGRRVETIASCNNHRFHTAGVPTTSPSSYCSDAMGSDPSCTSPSIWSKLNIFGSKSQLRHASAASCSSRTSSESGSPRASPVQAEEDDELTTVVEALEESFSFDTPKVETSGEAPLEESFSFDTPKMLSPAHETYLYAAVGWDDYNLYTRRRNNRETLSTPVVA